MTGLCDSMVFGDLKLNDRANPDLPRRPGRPPEERIAVEDPLEMERLAGQLPEERATFA